MLLVSVHLLRHFYVYNLYFEGTYSLDQMSDDEDLEPVRPRASGSGGQITATQLAAAFAAVRGGSQSPVRYYTKIQD